MGADVVRVIPALALLLPHVIFESVELWVVDCSTESTWLRLERMRKGGAGMLACDASAAILEERLIGAEIAFKKIKAVDKYWRSLRSVTY